MIKDERLKEISLLSLTSKIYDRNIKDIQYNIEY